MAVLAKGNKALITGLAIAIALLIGAIDRMTGPYIALSIFYVVPIFFAGWYGGRSAGLVIAVESALVGLVADVTTQEASGSLFPYWNAAGRLALFLLIAGLFSRTRRSLEQEKRTADQERAVADQLRELDEMKDAFLQSVAHDLRGPLGGILGSAITLAGNEEAVTREDARLLAHGIESMARRTSRIVGDLLDVERLKRGIMQPHRSLVDVGALVAGLVEGRGQGHEHPIIVCATPVRAWIDPVTLERIVENLLENAENHTPPGTRVWVRVEEQNGVLIAVDDEGPGVPAALRERVFQMFGRGTDQVNTPGLGLGLHIVARFAELHGGRAWVTERTGGGASFRVHIPDSIEIPPIDPGAGIGEHREAI